MEEKLNLVERALMSEEEFKKYLGNKADIVEDSLTVENPLTETLNLRDIELLVSLNQLGEP